MVIQVQRATEALNQGAGPRVSSGICMTSFSGQVPGNGALDNAQRLGVPGAVYVTSDAGPLSIASRK